MKINYYYGNIAYIKEISMFKVNGSLIAALLFITTPLLSIQQNEQSLRNKMLEDIEIVKSTFEAKYAPFEWKKTYADWDLNDQVMKAKAKIIATPVSIKNYQQILKQFFAAMQDYHAGVTFYSTETAALPFHVQKAQGRYFITWTQRSAVPSTWAVGDEVILFDGQPIDDAVQAINRCELGQSDSLTDQAFAEMILTMRSGAFAQAVPKGAVAIAVKHALTGQTQVYDLNWHYVPEKISPGPFKLQSFGIGQNESVQVTDNFSPNSILDRKMVPYFQEGVENSLKRHFTQQERDEGGQLIGSKNGFLPPLGKIIWQAPPNDQFYAYLYKTNNGQTIGYIRIPSYNCNGDAEAQTFARLIKLFEARSDALVVDQQNNSGGYPIYLFGLISMLTSTPIQMPLERQTIIQEDVYGALDNLDGLQQPTQPGEQGADNVFGLKITQELMQSWEKYFNFIIDEWNQGNSLSSLYPIYGMNTINPNSNARYSKPMVMLINHLDFSCADLMPAIMQDNKRALILGTRTAGAGGYVRSTAHPNSLGVVNYSYTGSIVYRADQNPVENLGVTPDITYEVTAEDLQNNYKNYVNVINKAVETVLKKR